MGSLRVKFFKNCLLRPFIHGGKDQHKSCTAHHGEPLLCPCLRTTCNFFLVIFLGSVMLPHPQATSTDHGGPRTSDLSTERRRRNHFPTAPEGWLHGMQRMATVCKGWLHSPRYAKDGYSEFNYRLLLNF